MSNVSSSQSSVGQLILAGKRLATSRQGPSLNLLNRPEASGQGSDMRSLYGQLAQKFLARRNAGQGDEAKAALVKAAAAATTSTKSASTSGGVTSSNADGDVVSLTKATSFRKTTRTSTNIQPVPPVEQNPSESITRLQSGGFDTQAGVFKSGEALREGRYEFSDDAGSISLRISRDSSGTLLASGTFTNANGEAQEFNQVKMTDMNVVQYRASEPENDVAPAPAPANIPAPASSTAPTPTPAPSSSSTTPVPNASTPSGGTTTTTGGGSSTTGSTSTGGTSTSTGPSNTTSTSTTPSTTSAPTSPRAAFLARLSEFGGTVTSSSSSGATVRFTMNGQNGEIRFAGDGSARGKLGSNDENEVRFELNSAGALRIDLGEDNGDSGNVTRENAIRVRTLLNKQTSTGEVGGSGMYAAAGSRVITTGNATADAALRNAETMVRNAGGTFTRGTGSSSSYSISLNGNTGTIAVSGVNATGRLTIGGVQTNYAVNLANSSEVVNAWGGNSTTQGVTRTTMNALFGRTASAAVAP
ncbi:MAG: hypothetical protein MUE97_05205 [Phycisphaerales bacterium]|jgi:hypothetical protein|nr:hypothetical protein [Phycisphaerales bacterium]